jgi:hypothetical protein
MKVDFVTMEKYDSFLGGARIFFIFGPKQFGKNMHLNNQDEIIFQSCYYLVCQM